MSRNDRIGARCLANAFAPLDQIGIKLVVAATATAFFALGNSAITGSLQLGHERGADGSHAAIKGLGRANVQLADAVVALCEGAAGVRGSQLRAR